MALSFLEVSSLVILAGRGALGRFQQAGHMNADNSSSDYVCDQALNELDDKGKVPTRKRAESFAEALNELDPPSASDKASYAFAIN
eukprot:1315091-Amorphochlora_amoeboformis.AAC.1